MKNILGYIRLYFRQVDRLVLLLCTIFSAILIYLNYWHGLEKCLTMQLPLPFSNFTGHYILFLAAFAIPYLFYLIIKRVNYFRHPLFVLLLLIAPAIFSLKMSLNTSIFISGDAGWNHYWNQLLYWPLRLFVITVILLLPWRSFDKQQPFYGLSTKNFGWQPYAFMLVLMIPLVAVASTQPDFLSAYPKLKIVLPLPAGAENLSWFYKLLFELSYGSDFFSIELFFRGFLILAFFKWTGKDAILPMVCFYCTIHFGKPLGECISSYFGGMLLGVVVYHTRSIYGGLIVHLGIAWLMELGGYLGNHLFG